MPSGSRRLNSWKEIAAYLDRNPRTVQLWEKHEGFPVHRLTHASRSSVYAHTAEIDEWLEARSGQLPAGERAVSGAVAGDSANPQLASGHVTGNLEKLNRESSASSELAVKRPTSQMSLSAWLWPLVIGVMAVGALGSVWLWLHSRRPVARAAAIAVLPFEDQAAPSQSFGRGLTDHVIAALEDSRQFIVIPRRLSQRYGGPQLSLPELASHLHIAYVVRGLVAEGGGQMSVTAELMDAVHDRHLWGRTFVFKSGHTVQSEEELAAAVAEAVSAQISGAPLQTWKAPVSPDPRAVQAYFAGRFYREQRDLPDLERAVSSFQKAIAIDNKFAAAYSALAETYDLMPGRGVISSGKAFRLAKKNARAALDHDPHSAQAYSALAFATYHQDWDFPKAEDYFRKAITVDPNSAMAHQWYGTFLGEMSRFDESLTELQRGSHLQSLSPAIGSALAAGYEHAGRLSAAEDELKRIIDMYPNFVPAHDGLMSVYVEKQELSAAAAEAREMATISGDPASVAWVQIRQLEAAGHMRQARTEAAQLNKGVPLDPYRRAQLAFLTGQYDSGYAALEAAFQRHSWRLVGMLVDPAFSSVRHAPRFLAVARRVGLPITPTQGQRVNREHAD